MTIRLLLLARRPIGLDGLPLDVLGAELEDSLLIRRPSAIDAALDEFSPNVALVDTTFDEQYEPGERVVVGQRLMQTMGDVFLGWAHHDSDHSGRRLHFYFRQLWDGKGSADVDTMGGGRLGRYSRLCGKVLAISHARTGDASMIAGYLGEDDTFDRALAVFAQEYADLTEEDHKAHLVAIDSGRIEAVDDID